MNNYKNKNQNKLNKSMSGIKQRIKLKDSEKEQDQIKGVRERTGSNQII